MLSAGGGQQLGQSHQLGTRARTCSFIAGRGSWLLFISLFIFISIPQGRAWPHDYRYSYNHCPGPEWSVMCRGCCEYDVIRCKCPLQGTPVGYAVPCCRNAINECDPCIIHPGCSVFENCKRCNNGTWGPRDDFFISGKFCAECRPGWSGGDCMKCGGVIRKQQGHLVLEGYPNNARCEWTIQLDHAFTIDLRFMMLSLEFQHSCRYDFVEVRDGDSINSPVIGRFCGNNRPAPIQSSGNSLHILFVSDGYKNYDGFFATFQESSACSSSPCLHDGTCILDTSYTYHCACLAGYTGKRCENVVGCHRPPVPAHGSTQGVFLHSGARITFHCEPGFELQGFRSAICLRDGTWSAPSPECVPVERVCTLPPKPTHGDHFLVYGPNDVLIALQYLCYKPYELSGTNQRTCLPNNTWSGTPPVCTKVNNTLTETGKDNTKEIDQGKETEINSEKDADKTKEKGHDSTAAGEKDSVAGKDINTGHETTTAVDRNDKYTVTTPEKPAAKDSNDGEPEERNTGSENTAGDNKDKFDREDPDNSLNAVEKTEPEVAQSPEGKGGIPDINAVPGSTDVTDVVVIKDKGQEEKERKEEQVNGKKDAGEVGPNDTKTRTVLSEEENAVEIFELEMTKNNNTVTLDLQDSKRENGTRVSPESGWRTALSGFNITLYTVYRAGGGEDRGRAEDKQTSEEENTGGAPAERTVEETESEEEKEKAKEVNQSFTEKSCPPLPRLYHGYHQTVPGLEPQTVAFYCNHSYVLSGDARRSCQPDGSWSGQPPLCLRACREPKVSELVKQRALSPQTPSRKTPVFKFYSSVLGPRLQSDAPTKAPAVLPQLPPGFHHLYTHIEYECASPFYHHAGSPRRTCLKTGKWSGRHVSCSPVCGKHPTFDQERPAEAHWPWLAAIYRRSTNGIKTKVTKTGTLAGSPKKDAGAGTAQHNQASDWQLVCSGALVNQRSVVVAAHCVTELGKVFPLDAAKIRVVVGKHYRDDHRESKGLQHLRVASIAIHPNFDPNILDSDLAVVKLLDKARVGERVLPLCFSESQRDEVTSGHGLVTGWSPLPDASLGADERARVGLVHLADVVPCEQQYARNGAPVSVTDNMLCASQKPDYGPSNICPSDTGGILVSPALSDGRKPFPSSTQAQVQSQGLWRLVGLVSFGYDRGDCHPDLYTVYTHVANFRDWIESNMK